MSLLVASGISIYLAKKLLFTRYVNTDKKTIEFLDNSHNNYSVEFRGKYFDEAFIVNNISGNETHDDIIRLLHILKYKFKFLYRHRLDKYDIKLKSDIKTRANGINIAYYYIPVNYKIKNLNKKKNNRVIIWVDLD